MTGARVVEFAGITAGIVVPEPKGVRFFSSDRSFDALDRSVFRSLEHAERELRRTKRKGLDSGRGTAT